MKYGESYVNDQDDENDLIFLLNMFQMEFYEAYNNWKVNNNLEQLKNKYSNISNRMNQVLNRINLVFYPF